MNAPTLDRRALVAGIVGTTASVMPAFLTGAVAVQLADDIGLDDRALGWSIGGFFASAALGSALLGRTAERLGGVRAMRIGLVVTMVTGLLLAAVVRGPLSLGVMLLIAGATNALTQPAANLLLIERLPAARMGFAFALKQAGMPMATLIGGALVPTVAVTVGWRWAYVFASLVAAVALAALPRSGGSIHHRPRPERGHRRRPDLPLGLLASYAATGLLGAAAAGAMTAFLVTAAEGSGIAEGPAGLLLTIGSAIGIISRLVHGRLADGPRLLPIRRVMGMLVVGAVGLFVFAGHTPTAYVIGLAPAFAAGWAWPGLFNLSVVRNNPSAPAAATGVSQTGVYIGAAAGPVLGGVIAEEFGYRVFWICGAAALLAGAAVAANLRVRLRRHQGRSPGAVRR